MICKDLKKDYPNCTSCSEHKRINATEKKRTYSAINAKQKHICKIKVDACVIKEGTTCDYLFLDCEQAVAYFIELKGQDLIKAIRQLNHTIDTLTEITKRVTVVHARVVLSKVNAPDIRHIDLIKFKKKLKKLGGNLRYESRKLIEKID